MADVYGFAILLVLIIYGQYTLVRRIEQLEKDVRRLRSR